MAPTPAAPDPAAATEAATPAVEAIDIPVEDVRSQPAADGGHPGPRSYVVEQGDHFWSIAERQVAGGNGEPDERTVARYWLRLVEHNRHRLVDPDNPDLIHAGLEIELP